jgi:hypothetical protein
MLEDKNEITRLCGQILKSPPLVGLLSFFLMVLLNISFLDNPPYWDDILGLHNQAVWLAKHNFNVVELWQPENSGSNAYRFGILPFLYGIWYSLFPIKTVHVLGHLFNIGCLALAFGTAYSIMRKFKVTSYLALLWCLAALCEPVMSGRTAALGQECPLLCAGVLSFYFLQEKRLRLTLLFIFLAMLCKMTAGVLVTAFTLWMLIDICLAGKERLELLKKYKYYLIIGIFLIAFFLFVSFHWTDDLFIVNKVSIAQSFNNLLYAWLVLVPVQFAALIVMGIVTIWRLVVLIRNKSILNLSDNDKFSLLILIFTGGFWFAYGSYGCSLPRYSAFVVFPVYIFIALNTFSEKKKWLTAALAFILLSLGVISFNGYYYLPLQSNRLRSGEYLERSREFLTDLRYNRKACKLLETKYFNRPVVAKWPFLQMLTIPEMGYVTKALPNVYAACRPINYAKVKVYDPQAKMPDNTLYVFAFNSLEAWTEFGPSLWPKRDKKYKIILRNQIRDGWFIIYEKEPEK